MKSLLVIVLLLVLNSPTNSYAQTLIVPNEKLHQQMLIADQQRRNAESKKVQIPADAIRNVAEIMAAMNLDVPTQQVENQIVTRIDSEGAISGFVNPSLFLIDLLVLTRHTAAASSVVASIEAAYPKTGAKLRDSLQLHASFQDPKADSASIIAMLSQETAIELKKYRDSNRHSVTSEIREIVDSAPISQAMLGRNSLIHMKMNDGYGFGYGDSFEKQKSPIYGFGLNDVRQCFANCQGGIAHGQSEGAKMYGPVGGAVGAFIPGVGAENGERGGRNFGQVLGSVVGLGVCAAKRCGGDNGGSGNTAGSPPTQPSSPNPAPSQPSSPSSGSDSSGGAHGGSSSGTPEPRTSAGGGDDQPGNDHCHSDECMIAMPVNDEDGGTPVNDTGHVAPRANSRTGFDRSLINTIKAPYVNPVRDLGGRKGSGF